MKNIDDDISLSSCANERLMKEKSFSCNYPMQDLTIT